MSARAFLGALVLGLLAWAGIFAAWQNPSLVPAGLFVGALTWALWQVARASERADARNRNR